MSDCSLIFKLHDGKTAQNVYDSIQNPECNERSIEIPLSKVNSLWPLAREVNNAAIAGTESSNSVELF